MLKTFRLQRIVGINRFAKHVHSNISIEKITKTKKLILDLDAAPTSIVNITTNSLQSNPTILPGFDATKAHIKSIHGISMISTSSDAFSKSEVLSLVIPEDVELCVKGKHVILEMKSKTLGGLDLRCQSGKVHIDKLKGGTYKVDAGNSVVNIHEIEGDAYILCGQLNSASACGSSIVIESRGEIALGNLDSPHAALSSDSINISRLRGRAQILARGGGAEIKEIDGSIYIKAKENIQMKFVRLSFGGRSSIISTNGSIQATIDPQLCFEVSCRSYSKNISNNISILSETFSRTPYTTRGDVVTGIIYGIDKSHKSKSSQSSGQNAQELQSSLSQQTLPILSLEAKNTVTVKTLNWIDAIAQKHGLESLYSEGGKDKVTQKLRKTSNVIRSNPFGTESSEKRR